LAAPLAALAAPALVAAPADDKPEPAVQKIVTEDDGVRIEELRFRGETRSITVKSKIRGARPYEIVPPTGARDPSQAGSTTGQRVWNVFAF